MSPIGAIPMTLKILIQTLLYGTYKYLAAGPGANAGLYINKNILIKM